MSRTQHSVSSNLNLLECTLRDGSYAVDFRFTYADTALLCQLLSELGFNFLEVGHGMGINASNAGKGEAPSSDIEFIKAAKSVAKASKIGMFCIPKVATLNSLKEAADAGLDFVRIGCNADETDDAFPYIECARKNNLRTFLNFMKSYAIEPKDFALRAKKAVCAGAQVIYIVDSAGCMLPAEVDEYIRRVKEVSDATIGFHGHNNLHLAVANTLQAVRSGADFVDTTLYGIGRNAGNAPTEVVLAVLKSMDIDLKIDIFNLMDVVDKYISPLMRQIQMYDMISVTMGFAKFHSGFLPGVKKISDEYNVDLRKLLFKAGKDSPSGINEGQLIKYAKELREVPGKDKDHLLKGHDLTSFVSAKIRKDFISNTLTSVEHLIEELVNVSAKKRSKIVLDIVPLEESDEALVFTEYVVSDQDMVMGRIKFGSLETLIAVLNIVKRQSPYLLINNDINVGWIKQEDIYSAAKGHLDEENIIFYSSRELITSYITDVVLNRKKASSSKNLLVIGMDEQIYPVAHRLARFFDRVFINFVHSAKGLRTGGLDPARLPQNCAAVKFPAEDKAADMNVDMVLSLVPLPKEVVDKAAAGFSDVSTFIFIDYGGQAQNYRPYLPEDAEVIGLDASRAYHGQFSRWINLR